MTSTGTFDENNKYEVVIKGRFIWGFGYENYNGKVIKHTWAWDNVGNTEDKVNRLIEVIRTRLMVKCPLVKNIKF